MHNLLMKLNLNNKSTARNSLSSAGYSNDEIENSGLGFVLNLIRNPLKKYTKLV